MRFNKTVLPNGLRLVTVPMADNPSVTVLVMVEAGSKYEDKETNGLSHFIEHMLFKGTPRRPKATDISRELDGIGAHYNAFTSLEFTGYYAKADARHLGVILNLISDLYQNPLFDEGEMKKEKGVIIEEIRMYQDIPQKQVSDIFMELVYGDQPAGWNVTGTEETVASFARSQLTAYRASHYVAGATTVIIAGSFDETTIADDVKGAFAAVPSDKKRAKLSIKEKQSAPAIKALFKETDQTHLIIGLRTFPVNDPRIIPMHVLSTILGKGMSSRLFAKMRDELGICYYVKTDHEPFTDHGLLTISAGLDNSRVKEGITGIMGECERLKKEPVPAAELKKAKDYIAGTTMLELETSDARAEYCGFQEIMKRKIDLPEEIIRKVNAVSAADIEKLAREIFVNEGLNLALIGRSKDDAALKRYFKFA